MKRNLIMRKTAQLMTTSCLVCVFKIPVNASQFQLPLAAFSNGGISTNPSEVLLLNQEVQQLNTTNATLQSDVITLNQQIQQLNATAATLQDELNAALAGGDNIGTLVDTVNSMTNIIARLTSQINNIKPSAGAVSTAVSDVMDLIGQPTGNATDSIYTRIGLAAQTDLTATLGGSSGTTISSRLGDPGSGNTLVNNIANGAASIQAAITTVQGNLASLSNSSLTPHHDLNRLLIDGNSSSTSGLIAKITGNSSNTILGGIEAVASNLDGSVSGSIAGTSSNSLAGKLATQISSMKNGETQLNTVIADVNSQLGGSGTTSARVTAIDNSILGNPTGVLATDLSSLAAEIVTSPSGIVETDVHTINSSLNGTATGSTIQARVTSIDNSILTTPSGTVSTDLASLASLMATSPGATLQSNVGTVNTLLDGTATGSTIQARVTSIDNSILTTPSGTVSTDLASLASLMVTSPGATLQSNVGTVNTLLNGTATGSTTQDRINSAIGTIENGATQLTTAISDSNTALGGSGTTLDRIYGVDVLLDGVQTMSGLSTFTVTVVAANPGGNTVNLVGNDDALSGITYTITFSSPIASGATFTLQTGPKTITFLNNSGGAITSAANLASYLSTAYPVNTVLKGNIMSKVTALQTFLGGLGYSAMSSVAAVDAALLGSPTGILASDLSTLAAEIVTSPSGVVETDVHTINSSLNGTGAGSTIQARINSAIATIESGATQLTTAISDANIALGGSGTTINRIYGVDALLDGVQTMSGLTSFTVSTAASNSSGTISIVGNDGSSGHTYSITFSSPIASGNTFILEHSGSGNTITFVNNSGGTISAAAGLATYLAAAYPVNAVLKANANAKATALKTFIGGTGYSSMSNALAIDAALLESPMGAIATDLSTLAAEIVTSPSGVVETDIKTLNSLLNGTATGSTTEARIGSPILGGSASNIEAVLGGTSTDIASSLGDPGGSNTLIGNIGGSTISVQAALNALSTGLVNNTNFSSSLVTQVTTLSTSVDNGLSSLPNSATTATISSLATSDGSGGVNVGFSGLGSANGTYNLPSGTITGSIGNGGTFTLTNSSNNLVLVNRSGTTINTQAKAISYLASMYPSGSKITSDLSDKISSGLNTLVGGTLSSVRARIAAADAAILVTPTGVLKTDLSTLAGEIVTSPSAVLEGDIQTINSLLNGTSTGSTIQARIGSPTLNSTSSDLASIIGGAASDIAGRLGDPITGTSGLAGYIRNNGGALGTVNDFDASFFDNATTLSDQLSAFLSIISQSNSIATNNIVIPRGTFSDLRSFLAALSHD